MGNWTKRPYRNDQDGKRKRTELPSTTQIIHPIPVTLHTGTERTTQPIRFLRPEERKRRNSSRCMEKNSGHRKKNFEFENITAAELLASKFLSLIGKSTGDCELKKKIREGDMSVEAITDAIHEYMYEKLNDSTETDEEKKIRICRKEKIQTHKSTNGKKHKTQKNGLQQMRSPQLVQTTRMSGERREMCQMR